MQILQSEAQHRTLSTAYDEIAKDRQLVTVTTRSAARGEPISLCTKKSVFFLRKFPATNYLWDAWRKQQITIKQQNAVKTANSDPKIAKTTGFPIDISSCKSSSSTEVNTDVNIFWIVWMK